MAKKANVAEVADVADENPYAAFKSKSDVGALLFENNQNLSDEKLLDLGRQMRPDLDLQTSDITNGKTKYRKNHGIIAATRVKRTSTSVSPVPSIADESILEAAYEFIDTCRTVENAISILEKLKTISEKVV